MHRMPSGNAMDEERSANDALVNSVLTRLNSRLYASVGMCFVRGFTH
jgi:hypothetical protein